MGVIIDEAQGHQQRSNYTTKTTGAKARHSLVLCWMLGGFFLTIGYKSVLRSMLMTVEYEPTIDTLEDVIMSEMPAVASTNGGGEALFTADPRQMVNNNLKEKVKYYQFTKNGVPDWVQDG